MSHPVLIYDGECPFCSNYVQLLKLRESFPGLELLDARGAADHPAVRKVRAAGLSIDEGMALVDGETIHHGAEVVHLLAFRSPATGLGRLNRAFFRSASRSRLAYPLLRGGRNLAVRLLGRGRLGF